MVRWARIAGAARKQAVVMARYRGLLSQLRTLVASARTGASMLTARVVAARAALVKRESDRKWGRVRGWVKEGAD